MALYGDGGFSRYSMDVSFSKYRDHMSPGRFLQPSITDNHYRKLKNIQRERNEREHFEEFRKSTHSEYIDERRECLTPSKRLSEDDKRTEMLKGNKNKSARKICKHGELRNSTDEEDHGYQSSESPFACELRLGDQGFSSVEQSNQRIEYQSLKQKEPIFGDKIHHSNNVGTYEDYAAGDTSIKEPQKSSMPFLERRIHDCILCCTNGFFRMTPGPLSEFESNCSCTTHTLVDWQTRVTWTNSNLRHQFKVQEVTAKSPFRSQEAKKLMSYSLSRLIYQAPDNNQDIKEEYGMPINSLMIREAQPSRDIKDKNITKEYEEKSYVCTYADCGRTFCRNEELNRHMRIHTGHKPFHCTVCGRGFVRRDHLAKHQRTHLPAHAKRTYSCSLQACTHSYTRSDALTRHMWTAHHIRARQPSRPKSRITTSETLQPSLTESSS